MTYEDFFRTATNNPAGPYPYQTAFAEADSLPHLLRVPTGAGKTATAVLGWLWRWTQQRSATPRRLIYCLPMRVLVEQSERECRQWLDRLGLTDKIRLEVLMGGVDTDDWHLYPERPAILLGTQDMLLSRALNRGYGASRFRWPIDFGLLNNDSLWVFDEPQLMANGVATSAQLAAFRQQFSTIGSCPSVWMSATLEPTWLNTVDFSGRFPANPLELTAADYDPSRPLHRRMNADKTLQRLEATVSRDMKAVAVEIEQRHRPGTVTLAVVNTVDRAKALYDVLQQRQKKRKGAAETGLLLVHSRFRPQERQRLNEQLMATHGGDQIIVATQVVEAGVDISASTLVFELCPWSSAVQRMGRCNRTGQDGPGQVYWLNLEDKLAPPYTEAELSTARNLLQRLQEQGVSPRQLTEFQVQEKVRLPFEHQHVLRRREFLDLFDTTADLSGNDIDISRYVRSDDPDTDALVFWRKWTENTPLDNIAPQREELCRVPIGAIREFVKELPAKTARAWVWDPLDGAWVARRATEIYPGATILLPTIAGGYDEELGWSPESKTEVTPVAHSRETSTPSEAYGRDPLTTLDVALTIAQHTDDVCHELASIADRLPAAAEWREALDSAARWHDLGKAHGAFQNALLRLNAQLSKVQQWAKSGSRGRLKYVTDEGETRPQFRHELASALAVLQHAAEFSDPTLVAYLVAAHHGKVRLSIRSLPGEEPPSDDPQKLFAMGVHAGDLLPRTELGKGIVVPETLLELSPMLMGDLRSWTDHAMQLLDKLGPFRLAWLEALLRAADLRASQNAQETPRHAST